MDPFAAASTTLPSSANCGSIAGSDAGKTRGRLKINLRQMKQAGCEGLTLSSWRPQQWAWNETISPSFDTRWCARGQCPANSACRSNAVIDPDPPRHRFWVQPRLRQRAASGARNSRGVHDEFLIQTLQPRLDPLCGGERPSAHYCWAGLARAKNNQALREQSGAPTARGLCVSGAAPRRETISSRNAIPRGVARTYSCPPLASALQPEPRSI